MPEIVTLENGRVPKEAVSPEPFGTPFGDQSEGLFQEPPPGLFQLKLAPSIGMGAPNNDAIGMNGVSLFVKEFMLSLWM